ncbi:asparagine synthase (glutamine-hydrolyzing) [Nitrospinae bacterium AH_259_B05_G02_I21]|nr:asparagine synthase (glutamine-hydrolyzing) [Nitrospinae bacterium AH_259_B05_G02_I21]MDA2931642.1 asparagine synthase (glutamine-hydrolyzing) [Nitrospinae bacterium AH-259-F20]
MCGIVAWVRSDGRSVDRQVLERMTAIQAHRGPDAQGVVVLPAEDEGVSVGLGHRRLKVLDPSPEGNQPMAWGSGRLWIVHNGEVYNFRELKEELGPETFRTATDTEVILAAYARWAERSVERFNGMFGFALWDGERGRLLAARDRLGIKPLYYWQRADGLAISSELKALLQLPGPRPDIDLDALDAYLTFGYVPAPATIYEGIRKLSPGHRLIWEAESLKVEPYWELPLPNSSGESSFSSEEEAAEAFLELLRQSVRRRLVSDVPLGAFLSGGLDSSLVVALMAEACSGPVETFTVRFRGAGYYDESPYAHQVSELFGTDHHLLEVEASAVEILPRLVWHTDEPFADSSAVPTYYLAQKTRSHVTVALSGTGGDDILAGYRRYTFGDLRRRFWWLRPSIARGLRHLAAGLPVSRRTRLLETFLLGQRFLEALALEPAQAYLRLVALCPEALKGSLYGPALASRRTDGSQLEELWHRYRSLDGKGDFVAKALALDQRYYLPDDLLVKEDRMTMAHGLEGRYPLLDHGLVEFCARLPSSMKVRGLSTKHLLKIVGRKLLPPSVVDRPKHGFAVPIGEWFRGELARSARELLLGDALEREGFFRRAAVERLWQEHAAGRVDHSPLLWALLVFGIWYETVHEA